MKSITSKNCWLLFVHSFLRFMTLYIYIYKYIYNRCNLSDKIQLKLKLQCKIKISSYVIAEKEEVLS